MDSEYSNKGRMAQIASEGKHRAFVGGMWDEIGQLQFDYMVSKGLAPSDRFVDVACGSMRGGRHFIGYLDPCNYFGFDINRGLIDAGLTHEVEPLGLMDRVDPANLVAAEDFAFPETWRGLDCGLGLSLFSHLALNSMVLCLTRLRPVIKPGGRFYATIFEVDKSQVFDEVRQNEKIVTHMGKDPYHYSREDIEYVAERSGWSVVDIEGFEHPRNQRMVIFGRSD